MTGYYKDNLAAELPVKVTLTAIDESSLFCELLKH
jgi:hypothetical protein